MEKKDKGSKKGKGKHKKENGSKKGTGKAKKDKKGSKGDSDDGTGKQLRYALFRW
jgi:hypothetical protein